MGHAESVPGGHGDGWGFTGLSKYRRQNISNLKSIYKILFYKTGGRCFVAVYMTHTNSRENKNKRMRISSVKVSNIALGHASLQKLRDNQETYHCTVRLPYRN